MTGTLQLYSNISQYNSEIRWFLLFFFVNYYFTFIKYIKYKHDVKNIK